MTFPFGAIVAVQHVCNSFRKRREEGYLDKVDRIYKNKKFVATQFIGECEYDPKNGMWENKKGEKVTKEFVASHLDDFGNIITKF